MGAGMEDAVTRPGNTVPSRSPETPTNYAVLVEPTGWSGRCGELAATIWRALEILGSAPTPPRPEVLTERFEVGPATIATALTKPVARQIVAVLRAMEIDAKLTRSAGDRSPRAAEGHDVAAAPGPARPVSAFPANATRRLARRDTQTRMPPREGTAPAETVGPPGAADSQETNPAEAAARTPQYGSAVAQTSADWPRVAFPQPGARGGAGPGPGGGGPLPALAQRAEAPPTEVFEADATIPDASAPAPAPPAPPAPLERATPAVTAPPEAGRTAPIGGSPFGGAAAAASPIIGWGQVVPGAASTQVAAQAPAQIAGPVSVPSAPASPAGPPRPGRASDDEAGSTSPNLAGNAWKAAGFSLRTAEDELRDLENLEEPAETALLGAATAGLGQPPAGVATAPGRAEPTAPSTGSPPAGPGSDNPLARLATARLEEGPAMTFVEAPSVRTATLLGAIAPGAGHAYLGDSEAGVAYAMSAPLLYPWVRSAREAAELARAQQNPRRRNPGGYRVLWGIRHALVFWVITVGIAVGAVALYGHLMRPSTTPLGGEGDGALGVLGTADAGAASGEEDAGNAALEDAAGATGAEGSGADSIFAEVEARRRLAEGQRLLLDARTTCRLGLYSRCATLACRARDLLPDDRPARRLCHEATLAAAMESEGQPVDRVFPWQTDGDGDGASPRDGSGTSPDAPDGAGANAPNQDPPP
jgi:hypothetical protein